MKTTASEFKALIATLSICGLMWVGCRRLISWSTTWILPSVGENPWNVRLGQGNVNRLSISFSFEEINVVDICISLAKDVFLSEMSVNLVPSSLKVSTFPSPRCWSTVWKEIELRSPEIISESQTVVPSTLKWRWRSGMKNDKFWSISCI